MEADLQFWPAHQFGDCQIWGWKTYTIIFTLLHIYKLIGVRLAMFLRNWWDFMTNVYGCAFLPDFAFKKSRNLFEPLHQNPKVYFPQIRIVCPDVELVTTSKNLWIKQVEAQLHYRPGSEIGVGWKIGVTGSRKRSFKMAVTELGYLIFIHKIISSS